MLELKVEITGATTSDLVLALEEVQSLITNGNTSGINRNESGRFQFAVSGEEAEVDEEA